jgi:hypothetical protein
MAAMAGRLVTFKALAVLGVTLETAEAVSEALAQPEQAGVVAVAVMAAAGVAAAALACLALALTVLLAALAALAAGGLAAKAAVVGTAEDLAAAAQVGIQMAAAAEHCVTLIIYLSPPEKP